MGPSVVGVLNKIMVTVRVHTSKSTKYIILPDLPFDATFMDVYNRIQPMFGNEGCVLLLNSNVVDINQKLIDAKCHHYACIIAMRG